MKYCNKCGNQLDDNVKFCMSCGAKQPDKDRSGMTVTQIEEEPTAEKSDNKKIIWISAIAGTVAIIIIGVILAFRFIPQKKDTTTEEAIKEDTTTEAPQDEVTAEDPETDIEEVKNRARDAFYDEISDIVSKADAYSFDRIWCKEEDSSETVVYKNYAMDDFDSDDELEFIVCTKEPVTSSTTFYFYEYDDENDTVETIHEVEGGPEEVSDDTMLFYGNGVIEIINPDKEPQDDEGTFLCVNCDIFEIMGCADKYDDIEEKDAYMVHIYQDDDGAYYMDLCSDSDVEYHINITEEEAKEYIKNLRDAETVDTEVCDFNLEDLADVCDFDYDEVVTEIEARAAGDAYYDMINGLVDDAVYYSSDTISVPDEYDEYVIYKNYAIADFDSDGVSELMVYSETNASLEGNSNSYGTSFHFYEYNAENDSVTLIHNVWGDFDVDDDSTIFYGNGVIEFTSEERESSDDGGSFICVNTNIFDIMGIDDIEELEEQNGCEMYEEPDMFKISIFKGDDGIYYMYFSSAFSVDYIYKLSEEEAKEFLENLRDADTIDAEINDFALEGLADVCGFDYDEAVARIEAYTPAADYDAMYGDIIYKYKELVDEGADYYDIIGEDYPYETNENCSLCYSVAIGDTSGEIGYLISNLDGDGVSELVIGVCDDSFVIDVYTIRDGNVVRILDSGERYSSFYCGDGFFYQAGSSGAAYYSCTLYRIISGGATFFETIYTEPEDVFDGNSATLYYYSDINLFDPENATEISEDEYNEKWNEYSSKCCNLTGLTPLSEY